MHEASIYNSIHRFWESPIEDGLNASETLREEKEKENKIESLRERERERERDLKKLWFHFVIFLAQMRITKTWKYHHFLGHIYIYGADASVLMRCSFEQEILLQVEIIKIK